MTNNITFPLTDEMVETLFNEGKCLTFHWWYRKNLNIHPTPEQYKKYHTFTGASHSAIFATANGNFHYFDNGVLLCHSENSPLLISKFENLIKSKGYPVTHKYIGMSLEDNKKIENYAVSHYDTSDAYKRPGIQYDEQIEDLFANGNVCLTASKNEAFSPELRKHIALFSDGRVVYNFDKKMRYVVTYSIIRDYPDYVYLNKDYTDSKTLEKIYQKAAEYPWYSSPEEAEKLYQKKHPAPSLTAEEQKRITELTQNNHCLTVDGGHISFDENVKKKLYGGSIPVDFFHYALFADGSLILASNTIDEYNKKRPTGLAQDLTLIYPQLSIKPEIHSEHFVKELYKALLKTQPSARDCYCELLKENARKLKSILHITHSEALEICAKINSWKHWHEVTTICEEQARMAIRDEKIRRHNFQEVNLEMSRCIAIEHIRRIRLSKHASEEDLFKNLANYGISETDYETYIKTSLFI